MQHSAKATLLFSILVLFEIQKKCSVSFTIHRVMIAYLSRRFLSRLFLRSRQWCIPYYSWVQFRSYVIDDQKGSCNTEFSSKRKHNTESDQS